MAKTVFLGSMMLCAWCAAAVGQEKDFARPIVEKAVKALGSTGKEKLKGVAFETKAKFMFGNRNIEFSGNWSIQGFDKVYASLDGTSNGIQKSITIVMNGKQIWAQEDNGKTEMAPSEVIPSVQGIFRAVRFGQSPGLLLHKDIKLSPLGEMGINNIPCVGLKVEQKGHKDINFYFDKATGLPAQVEVQVQESPGVEPIYSFGFSDFKEVDGIKHFTKMPVNKDQQPMMEIQLSNFRLVEELNANMFMKP